MPRLSASPNDPRAPKPEDAATPSPITDALPQGALFVSKSIATRQVTEEGSPFKQVIKLKNTGTTPWTGCVLARLATYGPNKKATDALGATSDSVPVATTKPGETATIELSLKATKSDPKSGAAQSAPWELRRADGTKIPIMVDATTQAKAGCVWTTVTVNPAPSPLTPDLKHAAYVDGAANTYVKIGNGGQCTAFVYGRIKEKLGVALEKLPGSAFGSNNAGQKWIDQLTGPGKPCALSQAPRANSVAVWSLTADPNQGHVAFVEGIAANGDVQYNEANWASWQSFASDNGPDSDTWGGGYDGKLKTATPAAMQTHGGPKYVLKAYILIG
jgi:surface antigen